MKDVFLALEHVSKRTSSLWGEGSECLESAIKKINSTRGRENNKLMILKSEEHFCLWIFFYCRREPFMIAIFSPSNCCHKTKSCFNKLLSDNHRLKFCSARVAFWISSHKSLHLESERNFERRKRRKFMACLSVFFVGPKTFSTKICVFRD